MNLKSQKVFVFFGLFYSGFICADKSYSKVSNSPNKYGEIEVIEVTAQKKVEQLHDVPLSVGVLGKNDIATHASNNIEQLQTSLPSISYRKGNTNRNSALTIRGIGTISFSIAAEPSVSTLVDGVVLARSGQAFIDMYDLERIEVLRGPQGTLFGKNASAGVVNFITRNPDQEFEANVKTTIFQDSEYSAKVGLSGGLNDVTSLGLTLYKSEFDGNLQNVFLGRKTNGHNKEGIRAVQIYQPDEYRVKLVYEYFNADDNCCTDIEGLPNGRNPISSATPKSQGIVNNVADIDYSMRAVDHDLETRTLDRTTGLSIQFDTDIDRATFTSISAYRQWKNTEIREGDFTSNSGKSNNAVDFSDVFFQLHDLGRQSTRQYSQELRIGSTYNNWQYQAGLFVWHIKTERDFTRYASCQNNNNQNQTILDNNPGLTCYASDIVSARADMNSKFNNAALFGQGTYQIDTALSLILGMRYTQDKVSFTHKRLNQDVFGRTGVGVRPEDTDFRGDTSNRNLSHKLGFSFARTASQHWYGSWSQGYKGPGFNVYYNMKPTEIDEISSEQSDAFELGLKYSIKDLRINTALFYTEIDDFQANNFDCSTGVCITRLTNAGKVTTKGVELDMKWQPLSQFNVSLSAAYVRAQIDKFNCPDSEVCTDRSDLAVPFAPKLRYMLAGNYEHSLSDYDLIFYATYSYSDQLYSELPNASGQFNPASRLKEVDILNAGIAISSKDNTHSLTFIGKNLLDKHYAATYSGDNFRYQIPRLADRHFGLSYTYNFN